MFSVSFAPLKLVRRVKCLSETKTSRFFIVKRLLKATRWLLNESIETEAATPTFSGRIQKTTSSALNHGFVKLNPSFLIKKADWKVGLSWIRNFARIVSIVYKSWSQFIFEIWYKLYEVGHLMTSWSSLSNLRAMWGERFKENEVYQCMTGP